MAKTTQKQKTAPIEVAVTIKLKQSDVKDFLHQLFSMVGEEMPEKLEQAWWAMDSKPLFDLLTPEEVQQSLQQAYSTLTYEDLQDTYINWGKVAIIKQLADRAQTSERFLKHVAVYEAQRVGESLSRLKKSAKQHGYKLVKIGE